MSRQPGQQQSIPQHQKSSSISSGSSNTNSNTNRSLNNSNSQQISNHDNLHRSYLNPTYLAAVHQSFQKQQHQHQSLPIQQQQSKSMNSSQVIT
jgi:hypothetical protein